MKKKLALILTLMFSLVALFAFSAVSVSADSDWTVEVNEVSVIKDGSVTVTYTLKYGDDVVTELLKTASDGTTYAVSPTVQIYDGETLFTAASGNVIDAKDMAIGEKTLTLKVLDTYGEVLAEKDFNFSVVKKDNTMTIVMIVLIVLLVAWMIWSNYSGKKKQAKAQSQASQLKIGDRVKTIGGVCGFVSEINDAENTFTLEVGKDSFVKFDKGAIYQTAPAQGSAVAQEEKKEEAPAEENKEEK